MAKILNSFLGPERGNATFWKGGIVSNGPIEARQWGPAVSDVFAIREKPIYFLGCQMTAICMHLAAVAQAIHPRPLSGLYPPKRGTPGGAAVLGVTLGFREVPKERDSGDDPLAIGFPGMGYINNITITDDNASATGENVVYMGGCFEKQFAPFRENADFFGHRASEDDIPVKKLRLWMEEVDGWSLLQMTSSWGEIGSFFKQP